jgi:hypothetical protein
LRLSVVFVKWIPTGRETTVKKLRRVIWVAFAIAAVLAAGAIPVTAKVTKNDYTGIATLTEVTGPEKQWIDEAGILHIRGLRQAKTVAGGMVGTMVIMVNIDVDAVTLNGVAWGKWTYDVTFGDQHGTFEGTWHGTYTGPDAFFEGWGICHGIGDTRPITGRGYLYDLVPGDHNFMVVEGSFLDPHGE